MNFENKISSIGVHYSRIIASWRKEGGNVYPSHRWNTKFTEWAHSIGCTDEEIIDMTDLATNGKMELEASAREFLLKEAENEK